MADSKNLPKTRYWILLHIIYPMLPFILDGAIRLVTNNYSIDLHVFSPEKLAISIGLMSIFVHQSILTRPMILPNDQDELERNSCAQLFMIFAIISFGIFSLLVLLSALHDFRGFDTLDLLNNFSIIIYIIGIIPISSAIIAQRSFKLKARL